MAKIRYTFDDLTAKRGDYRRLACSADPADYFRSHGIDPEDPSLKEKIDFAIELVDLLEDMAIDRTELYEENMKAVSVEISEVVNNADPNDGPCPYELARLVSEANTFRNSMNWYRTLRADMREALLGMRRMHYDLTHIYEPEESIDTDDDDYCCD